MSKLSEMIEELCPEGVEYVRLGEVGEIIRGTRVTKKDLITDGKYPVVSGGVGFMGYLNDYNREAETITIAQYGTAGYVNWQEQQFWANDICFCVNPNEKVIKKYLYYFLTCKQNYLYSISNRDAIPYSIDREKILNISLPLPPLPIQQEIVRILDTFTQLQTELQTELQLRKKQYNYYREHLLTFPEDVPRKRLGEVCEIIRGKRVVRKQLGEGQYPVYQNSLTPLGYYDKSNCKGATSFVICAGNAGEIGYSDEDFWAADDCFYVITPEEIVNKFVYYNLLNQQNLIKSKVRKASVPRLSHEIIENLIIPLPPLEKQREIASILDKFSALTTSLTEGIPAEIELRRKQYNFYREKLLTFRHKQ